MIDVTVVLLTYAGIRRFETYKKSKSSLKNEKLNL